MNKFDKVLSLLSEIKREDFKGPGEDKVFWSYVDKIKSQMKFFESPAEKPSVERTVTSVSIELDDNVEFGDQELPDKTITTYAEIDITEWVEYSDGDFDPHVLVSVRAFNNHGKTETEVIWRHESYKNDTQVLEYIQEALSDVVKEVPGYRE